MLKKELPVLFDQLRSFAESDVNQQKKKYEAFKGGQAIPGNFQLYAGYAYWSRCLDIDMREFFKDASVYLNAYLQMQIGHFQKFNDCSSVSKVIKWAPGVVFETSLLGAIPKYLSDKDPWDAKEPILNHHSDMELMEYLDFEHNPFMKYVLEIYNRLVEIVSMSAPDFEVGFPTIFRSPFGVACTLRGMENILFDMVDNPDFVHRLMSFVTEYRIKWEKERSKFLGRPVPRLGEIGNDEMNSPILSPALYKEFILPYERKLKEFYGEIGYFHSCGNITPMLESIKTLAPKLLHVSPWTDLETAFKVFSGTETKFDIWVHTSEDLLRASKEHVYKKIKGIVDICAQYKVPGYKICSGNIQRMATLEEDDEKIKTWVDVCRDLVL